MIQYDNLSVGAFLPQRLHLLMNVKEEFVGKDKYGIYLFHEVWHYYQTCMTSFGYKCWNLYRQSVGVIFSEWCDIISMDKDCRRIPLGYLASLGGVKLGKSVLLYESFMTSTGATMARVVTDSTHISMKDLSLILYDVDWLIKPFVIIKNQQENIEAIHVIEGQAFMMEALYGELLGVPLHETLDRKTVPKKYFICIDYFTEKLGSERITEFPVVCDIALQAYWTDPVQSSEDWKNSHPGWRFVYIIDMIIENNIKLDLNRIKEDYERYCDEITKSCGYKSIKEALNCSINSFSKCCLMETEAKILQCLKFRYENLICGAFPFLDMDLWKKMKEFHPPIIQREDMLYVDIPSEAKLKLINEGVGEGFFLETICEFHLQALVAQILGRKHSDCSDTQIACGFRYFNIPKGCIFQDSGQCDGIVESMCNPSVTCEMDDNENISGCTFASMLLPYNIKFSDISVNFSIKLPRIVDLKQKII